MSFDTPEGRRDEYIKSCLKVGARIPTDDEIESITGYVKPSERLGRSIVYGIFGALSGCAIVLVALWITA